MSQAGAASPFVPTNGAFSLTPEQRVIVERPIRGETLFLEGPAGVGKTTVAVARLRHLLAQGIPADKILILAPQRTLLAPYQLALHSANLPPGGVVDTLTVGGLARRMVSLFWPLVARNAGFAHPEQPPTFLTLETAQYYMARVTEPLIQAGAFEGVTIDHNRLISQILDNLNKAALMGLDYTQVGERLKLAWSGASVRASVYDRAQQCANDFRAYCLAQNLLDFSLQIEVFVNHLLTLPWPPGEGFMTRFARYRHLIVDNVEEDTPVTHDLLRAWLPGCGSATVIYDHDAGYRLFLGADPTGALSLRQVCRRRAELFTSFVTTPNLRLLGYELARSLRQTPPPIDEKGDDLRAAIVTSETALRFHTQMLDWTAHEIAQLVHERDVSPGQIAVLAPYLSDALRFALSDRLTRLGVPVRSHRPSRALRDEPATRCLLTLAALAHPQWNRSPLQADVAHTLALVIEQLDLVRAQLLTSIVYRPHDDRPALTPFADLKTSVQERIGYRTGNLYDALRDWLYQDQVGYESPLDHFFSRLFSEVLSQPGYGFHLDLDAGRITAQLIESARKFRLVMKEPPAKPPSDQVSPPDESPAVGLEYTRMVERGVIAAQYVPAWGPMPNVEEAVLLTPAYTFLMRNRPVDYQFWLNVGSPGWWERLYQPLTHPYVLTRHWHHGDVWTDAHEVETQTQALHRLAQGLIRRCHVRIYLGISDLGEQGYEQRGPLLQAIQAALRRKSKGAKQS